MAEIIKEYQNYFNEYEFVIERAKSGTISKYEVDRAYEKTKRFYDAHKKELLNEIPPPRLHHNYFDIQGGSECLIQ